VLNSINAELSVHNEGSKQVYSTRLHRKKVKKLVTILTLASLQTPIAFRKLDKAVTERQELADTRSGFLGFVNSTRQERPPP
jgi:hypothetical protein